MSYSIGDDVTMKPAATAKGGYELAPGKRLGDYEIVKGLGIGGMGQVYEAVNIHMRKRYALNLLPRSAADTPAFVERFRTEARVMADLQHPNIN